MDEFTEFQLRRLSDTEQQILAAVVRHLLGKIARNPDLQRGSIKLPHDVSGTTQEGMMRR